MASFFVRTCYKNRHSLHSRSGSLLSSNISLGQIMRQIYKITYPTGKIYIGKDLYGSYRYFGSPDKELINSDFANLSKEERRCYSVTKEILWESEDCSEQELSQQEVECIRKHDSNNPAVGYNRWPKYSGQ